MNREKLLCEDCKTTQIGLSAMTESICVDCGKNIWNESTNTDKICKKCSKAQHKCISCGKQL